ncbi:MAG: MBL fold metallo-hydrolase [Archaeoglobaceae archaeon]|nr:MBL fold metallo-hydrolase [Archaeoglobaceae archaeon]MCX8152316.1 MBL fold metallo-hydrolase [Archaeoglobaceae archaeon]MDW8013656.1 MBL fold metallo-hydrolase [Archaeoglobaceae archaeon]
MEVLPKVYMIDTFKHVEENLIACYALNFEKAVLIDPGTQNSSNYLLEELKKLKIRPSFIAPTHVHIDHAGSAARLAKIFSAKILAHPRGAKHLANPEKLWEASKLVLKEVAEIYGKPESIDESEIIVVEDGKNFDLGGDELIVFHSPGHAPHMLSYYLKDLKVLFPADAVGMYFDGHLIPLTPPPFDFNSYIKTVERFKRMDIRYIAFTHFGLADKEVLEKAEEKIRSWFEIAKESDNLDQFSEKLMKDEDVKTFFEKYSKKKIALSFFTTSIPGLFEAAKK